MVIQNTKSRSIDVMLGFLPIMLGLQLIIWIVYFPATLSGHADFRNCYAAGLIVRSGEGAELYNYELQGRIENTFVSVSSSVLPYVHMPYEALLFAPFTLLSYSKAFLTFLGLNTVFLLIAYWLWQRRLRSIQVWQWFPLLFFVGYAPISAALLQGQDSILTLLLFSAALISLDAKRDMLAGSLVGLALYKIQIVLPIAILFLLWRRWKFIAGVSTSAISLLLVSAMITGTSKLVGYFVSLPHIATTLKAGGTVLYVMPASSMPNIRGTILAIPYIPVGLKLASIIVVSLLVLTLAFWAGIKNTLQWQFALAILASTLTGYHGLMHDLSILLIPLATLLIKGRGLWTVPLVWLSAPLCFLGYSSWVTLTSLALFVTTARLAWQYGCTSDLKDLDCADLSVSQCC